MIKKKLTVIFLLIGAILAPATLLGQDNALLRVVVTSQETGIPLPGANALVYYSDVDTTGQPDDYCITNKDGFCEIRNLDSDREFILKVTYVSFKIFRREIVLKSNQREVLLVGLIPEIEEIDEITVERQRYVSTGEAGVKRIDRQDISKVPTPGVDGDLATYLQTVPGVVSTGDRGGNLFIRGGTPDQNQVLVDNLFIVKPFHISNLFSSFPEEVIQNVDLFAGGFDAEYSGASSAVLDVSLRPGNMKEFNAYATGGAYISSIFLEGPIEEDRKSFFVLGRKSLINQYSETVIGEDVNIEFGDIKAKYSVKTENVTCGLTGMYTFDSGEIVPGRNITNKWNNTVIGGRCLGYNESNNFPIEFTMGYTNYENSEENENEAERYSSVTRFYLSTDLKEQYREVKLSYGFGLSFDTYKTELSERFASFESFERTLPVFDTYASSEWEPVKKVKLNLGLASQVTTTTPVTIEPRLRVSYKFGREEKNEISFAAGQYAQLVSGINDERDIGSIFTVINPDEEGDPVQSATHFILRYQQRANLWMFSIENYLKKHRNIAVSKWNPEAKIELEKAFAKSLAYGFDFFAEYRGKFLFLSLGYGWAVVNYEAVSGDLGAWIEEQVFGFSPAHDQRHKLNTVLSYQFSGFEFNTRWEFGSGRPYTQIFGYDINVRPPAEDPSQTIGNARLLFSRPYGSRLPYYHRLDISFSRDILLSNFSTLELEAGAVNIYNRKNVFNFDLSTLQRVDQTPLLPYISMKISFN